MHGTTDSSDDILFVMLVNLLFVTKRYKKTQEGESPVLDKTTIWSPGWKTVFSSGLMLMELSLLW